MKQVLFIDNLRARSAAKRVFSGFPDVNMIHVYCDDPAADAKILPVYDAIVALGNVGEDSMGSCLIRKAVADNVPVLGIAEGARVVREACDWTKLEEMIEKPFWSRIGLTESGRKDIIFYGMKGDFFALQTCSDAVFIPEGIIPLALSEQGHIRAFRYRNAYVLYFHIDVASVVPDVTSGGGPQKDDLILNEERQKDITALNRTIYGNFLWLVDLCRLSESPFRRGLAGQDVH